LASLIQMSEAIETGKIRFSGDPSAPPGFSSNGVPNFNHQNPVDWLHKRGATAAASTEYISLLRKCE
jgi:hypothetical protein